mgnify:FL=1
MNKIRKILAIMSILVLLICTMVPVYAIDYENGFPVGTEKEVLEALFGSGVKSSNTYTATNPYSYELAYKPSAGANVIKKTVYLNVKPDLSAVTVGIDETGRLNLGGMGDQNQANAWNNLFARYKAFIVGISGIGAITMIVLFIVNFLKLGTSAGNPQARSQALSGVLWTGLAAAGLGAATIIVGFFYNAI